MHANWNAILALPDRGAKSMVLTGDELVAFADTPRDLPWDALCSREILCGIVPDYFKKESRDPIAERLLASSGWSGYVDESAAGISTLAGHALFDCAAPRDPADLAKRDERCNTYFDTALESREMVRRLLDPLANPIDVMQIAIDEAWPGGCRLLRFGEDLANAGMIRAFAAGGEALPHTDWADRDFPSPQTGRFIAQFAILAYLAMAEKGGELELWPFQPSVREYDELRSPGSYGLRRELLPAPSVVIRPEPGSLVVFNAWKVHAVRPSFGGGVRLTVSAFLGYRSPHVELLLFS